MFRKELSDKFKSIFGLAKVTYDMPGVDAKEQDCLFVSIEKWRPVVNKGRIRGMAYGKGFMYGPNDKIPFGFFTKAIFQASHDLTKDIFFYEIESGQNLFLNIGQKGFSFVYFFNGQYDPNAGSITSIGFETTLEG